jgi:hypothetical protein
LINVTMTRAIGISRSKFIAQRVTGDPAGALTGDITAACGGD